MKRPTEPTHETFLKDVANHEMDVKLDQGVYRHIVFSQPMHRFLYRFELITTPGLLVIHGDMETWAFSRVDDMFTFFRGELGKINCSYWAEKLQAGRTNAKRFDGEYFKDCLIDSLDGYDLEGEKRAKVIEELNEIEWCDDESWTRRQVDGIEADGFKFQDTYEISGKRYTYHFVWCLYAIVWGIAQYDASKEPKP